MLRLLLTISLVATGALADSPEGAELRQVDMPGIVNFSVLEDSSGLAGPLAGFGGATQTSAYPALKDEGFSTVINLRLADENGNDVEASHAAAEAAGLNYIHLPFSTKNPGTVIDDFLAAIGAPENQPVYVHCGSATRVAALWMIGRVLEDGWDIDQARAEAEQIAAKPEQAIAFATKYLAEHGK